MTRAEWNALTKERQNEITTTEAKMNEAQMSKSEYWALSDDLRQAVSEYRGMLRVERVNAELNKHNLAYRIEDVDGNQFCYGGEASGGLPLYNGSSGSKHIFDLVGYKVLQQWAE